MTRNATLPEPLRAVVNAAAPAVRPMREVTCWQCHGAGYTYTDERCTQCAGRGYTLEEAKQ